jgi:ribosomal protein S18 acetylase RimI-like enzyme
LTLVPVTFSNPEDSDQPVSSQPVIDIRRGVASDAAMLAEFAARTFNDTFAADNRPEDLQSHLAASFGVAQQTKELVDPNVITLLAVSNGGLVAYAQIRRNLPPPCVTQDQTAELHRFYVDRPAHGSGIASVLMSEVHRAAHELGGRQLWLGVWERNARAIAFYKKIGFVDVGSHDFYVGADRQTDRVLLY